MHIKKHSYLTNIIKVLFSLNGGFMSSIIEKSRKSFFDYLSEAGSDPFTLKNHVIEVERWAKKILKNHPKQMKK